MNYIWEALLKADKQKINRKNINFVQAEIYSPYMEVSLDELNLDILPQENKIEINPNYRFYEIFKDLFDINVTESKELRQVLLDILMHFLGEMDLKQGICKEEFQKQFILKDIINSVYGESLKEKISYFNKEELDVFLGGIISLYKTGTSLHLFIKILKRIFNKCIVYSNREKPKDIYIYLNKKKNKDLDNKINAILDTFLPINMQPLIFWDRHFGIIGVDDVMRIDEIVMVK